MKATLYLLISAGVLLGSYMIFRGSLSQNALILIGAVVLITAAGVVCAGVVYPMHKRTLTLSICGLVLLLFAPCFATEGGMAMTPLSESELLRFLLTFLIASVILVVTVILSYRHYFIIND